MITAAQCLAVFLVLCAAGIVAAWTLPERHQPVVLTWVVNAYATYVLVLALLAWLVGRGHDLLLLPATGLGIHSG